MWGRIPRQTPPPSLEAALRLGFLPLGPLSLQTPRRLRRLPFLRRGAAAPQGARPPPRSLALPEFQAQSRWPLQARFQTHLQAQAWPPRTARRPIRLCVPIPLLPKREAHFGCALLWWLPGQMPRLWLLKLSRRMRLVAWRLRPLRPPPSWLLPKTGTTTPRGVRGASRGPGCCRRA